MKLSLCVVAKSKKYKAMQELGPENGPKKRSFSYLSIY